jgi:tetratricopeptide (TPR) repeat protein
VWSARRRATLRGLFALGAALCFLAACGLLTVFLAARLVPPRYVARFVPEPFQAYFHPAPAELPTPATTPHAIVVLLTPIPVPSSPKPPPVIQPTRTVQPTTILVPPTSTLDPHATLTLTPVTFPNPTIAARATPVAIGSATKLLTGFRHTFQTWNNCGPANLTMALSYYGWTGTQAQAAAFLKPDPEDRNVSPDEMAAFARSQGFQVLVRANGTLDLLQALIGAGFAPIVEKGFEPDDKLGWMGHYEVIAGWSDAAREFIAMDSYLGPNLGVPFDEMDRYWRQFNWTYIVIYKPEQTDAVARIIGAEMDDLTMYRNALARAQAELAENPNDAFGWFNLGTNYVALGMLDESAKAYDQARRLGLPWRMTWYQFGWFEAYLAVERAGDVIALADATLKSNPYSEEMYFYKGLALEKRGDANAAREQFELALKHNPNFSRARQKVSGP